MDVSMLVMGVAFFVVALLYALVGHAGATGYLAVMVLLGTPVVLMKPTALVCNILVASIACYHYFKQGAVSFRLLLPLAVVSIPCAYVGGLIQVPPQYYKPMVGVFLLFAAYRAGFKGRGLVEQDSVQPVSWLVLGLTGALLGFLSGLTGVGGGVFLSPLMLLFRWAPVRTISGIAAGFIWVNSMAGLLGWLSVGGPTVKGLEGLALAVMVGGYLGAEWGSHRIATDTIRKLLALTLLIAGTKLVLSVV